MAIKRKPRDAPAWGRRISKFMDAAGISVQDLATALSAHRTTIYHYRLGTRIPSEDVRPLLARKLGVTVSELNGVA